MLGTMTGSVLVLIVLPSGHRERRYRGQLAAFLRSRRARLTPADVGLPADSEPGRRRTPGLRREEVAELSGVGVTWYTWLEQGRNITGLAQVIDALARALRLSADEHRHLRELAGLAAAPAASGDDIRAGCSGWSMPPPRTPPRSTTSTSTTWRGTSPTSGSGMIRPGSRPAGATCCG